MNKLSRMRRLVGTGLILHVGMVAMAQAQTAAKEAGPGAPPKMIACMNACEQTQMACLQGVLQVPVERRTIKDINQGRACNRAEERCDHKCRGKR